ncbi:glycosyltransferase [Algibacter sp.]|nr:glycosyltransferase [Algibacter sp.]
MKVLQLIDSLEGGGTERVAVNLANALSLNKERTFLCTTRKEGPLKESLFNDVEYLFLDKRNVFDVGAIKRLSHFVKANDIQIIHAHSSSFFLATIVKFLNYNISIIWHDHYGNSAFLEKRKFRILKFCSRYFSHIFSVNKSLEVWAHENLKIKNITYLPNVAVLNEDTKITSLEGILGKRIICLANLRSQKDHFTLINAFKSTVDLFPEWTLHCVGKDFNDKYSKEVKSKIEELHLEKSVFLYDSKPDVAYFLKQCEIGVLSSKSEGLPIALLEYGLSNLAVIATKVGECETVISNDNNGLLIEPCNANQLGRALRIYLENMELRITHASRFNKHILENYSMNAQLQTINKIYTNSIN